MLKSSSQQNVRYEKYLERKGALWQLKSIIDYFVYLKDDELYNEFPQEAIRILENTISELSNLLNSNETKITPKDRRIYTMTIEVGERVIQTSTVLPPVKLGIQKESD